MMRPLILITNDDGVYSPGLAAAAEAVQQLGDLLIAAPRFQQTSMGRSFPKNDKTGIIERIKLNINKKEVDAFGVYGSPAQSVAHAVFEISERKPDLCISGINYGENLGLCLTCSGTLGAAFEADSHDIPSIAVSLEAHTSIQHSDNYAAMNWNAAKRTITKIASAVLKKGMPDKVNILNINIPDTANENTEIRITKQSRSNYFVFVKPEPRDFNSSFKLKSELKIDLNLENKNSDVYAVFCDRVISVTPIKSDLSVDQSLNLLDLI